MVLLSVSQHLGIQVTVVDKFWGPQFIFSGPYFLNISNQNTRYKKYEDNIEKNNY